MNTNINMSYRDTRNFVEMTRALGFPRHISLESFRSPDFPLVAELLVWLVKRIDPDNNFPLEINTEDERVQLVRSVAQFMALKANVKLNTRRLYQADGYAVKEFLKITALLYDALNVKTEQNDDNINEGLSFGEFDITDKVGELKLARQLATEITASGATLFELLGKEVDLRVQRQKSLSRQFEIGDLETALAKAIEAIGIEIAETNRAISNIATTEAGLDAKIERRKAEIDRYEKRLQTLKKVRPAFLDEFTALEKELEQLFIQYSLKQRCLNHLEKLFVESERNQYEKQMQVASPRVETIPFENVDDDIASMQGGRSRPQERPRAGTGGRNRTELPTARIGSASSLELSSDTGSEDLFLDKEEPELMNSDDDDDDDLTTFGLDVPTNLDRRAPSALKIDVDDDF